MKGDGTVFLGPVVTESDRRYGNKGDGTGGPLGRERVKTDPFRNDSRVGSV